MRIPSPRTAPPTGLRTILRAAAAITLAALTPAPALAYGPATHAAIGERAALEIAQDPRYAFLAQDAGLRACYVYGSIFPDMRQAAAGAPQIESLKRDLESRAYVKRVLLSTDEVRALGHDTHDRAFLLFLCEKAEQSGSRAFLAFALGNLSHAIEDAHAQSGFVPHMAAKTGAADIAVQPAADPAALARWGPGSETEGIVEGCCDGILTSAQARLVRDVRSRLVSQGSAVQQLTGSVTREAEMKHLYYLAAKEYYEQRLGRTGFITEKGFTNSARIFDAILTMYPYAIGKERLGDAARVFQDRYIDLPWWADALSFVGNVIVRVFTLGQRGVWDVLAAIAFPKATFQGAIAGADPSGEIIFAFLQGGADEQAVRRKYGSNPEFQRLLSSGLLDRARYASPVPEAAKWARDLSLRRAASRFADPAQFSLWDARTIRSGGTGGLATRLAAQAGSGFASEPSLLVSRIQVKDRQSGAALTEVRYPQDVGRLLRLEVEILAAADTSGSFLQGRDVTVRVRGDMASAGADPLVAEGTRRLSVAELTPGSYGLIAKPLVTLDFAAPADVGQAGLVLEADAGRGVFFTSKLERLLPVTGGAIQYPRDYATYGFTSPSLRIRR